MKTLIQYQQEAADSANYFISRGYDATGNAILYASAYLNKAIQRATEAYYSSLNNQTDEDIAFEMLKANSTI